ncbi:MAG: hypothetical protein KKF89_01425 [Nanoarchaeota archaeon]|nr:hypothetical protein [Nanoarchaeota archaeon]MBU1854357.1 hypothetical protein [Nanoarchaeota archaeon]
MVFKKTRLQEYAKSTLNGAWNLVKLVSAPVIGSLDERTQRVFYNLAPRDASIWDDRRYRDDLYISWAQFSSKAASLLAYPILGNMIGKELQMDSNLMIVAGFMYGLCEVSIRSIVQEEYWGIYRNQKAYPGTLIGSTPGTILWMLYDLARTKR